MKVYSDFADLNKQTVSSIYSHDIGVPEAGFIAPGSTDSQSYPWDDEPKTTVISDSQSDILLLYQKFNKMKIIQHGFAQKNEVQDMKYSIYGEGKMVSKDYGLVIGSVRLNMDMIYLGQTYKDKQLNLIELTTTSTDRKSLEEIVLMSDNNIIAVLRNYTEDKSLAVCRLGTTIIEKVVFNGTEYVLGQLLNNKPITTIGIIQKRSSPDTRVYFYDTSFALIAYREMCDFIECWYLPYSLPF